MVRLFLLFAPMLLRIKRSEDFVLAICFKNMRRLSVLAVTVVDMGEYCLTGLKGRSACRRTLADPPLFSLRLSQHDSISKSDLE